MTMANKRLAGQRVHAEGSGVEEAVIPLPRRENGGADEPAVSEGVTLPWEQWEREHAQKRRRLLVIVTVAMIGIVGVWAFSVSGTIDSLRVAGSANAASARSGFLERFSDYQKRLDAFNAEQTAISTTPQQNSTAHAFVESLKTHAAEAVQAPAAPTTTTP